MDDVLDVIRWGLAGAVVLKSTQLAVGGHGILAAAFAACALLLMWRLRLGAAATIAVGLALPGMYNHTMFLLAVAAVTALFPDREQRRFLLATQLTAVWVFAGLAKLKPQWTTGQVLSQNEVFWGLPVPETPIVGGTIALELAVLPLLLWVRPRWAWWAGLAFHAGVAVGMSSFVGDSIVELWAFNLLFVAVLWEVCCARGSGGRLRPGW